MADDTAALSRSAGFIQGFTGSLMGNLQQRRAQEAAAAKFQAYMDLQRELAGNKNIAGQELADLALSLNINPDIIRANIDPGATYPTSSVGPLLNNLRELQTTSQKQGGATERAKIYAGARSGKGGGGGAKKVFDVGKAQDRALLRLKGLEGIGPKVSLGTITDKAKLTRIREAFPVEFGREVSAWETQTGQKAGVEPFYPYDMTETGLIWKSPRSAAPSPGAAPTPAAAPLPTPATAAPAQVVGAPAAPTAPAAPKKKKPLGMY